MSGNFGLQDPNLVGVDTGRGPYVPPTPRHPEAINEVPEVMEQVKYYVCPVPNASFHTPGGTRIPFVSNFYKTDIQHIQQYLDNEIKMRNAYVRHATQAEIDTASMRENPRGFITQQVRAEVEQETREKLMTAIRDRLARGEDISDIIMNKQNSPVDTAETTTPQYDPLARSEFEAAQTSADNMPADEKTAKPVTTDVGTGVLQEQRLSAVQLNPVPHLGGIQSSVDIKDNAAGSAAS